MWLLAWWAIDFFGEHQHNIERVLIYRCCVVIHAWCLLLSDGNKVTTTITTTTITTTTTTYVITHLPPNFNCGLDLELDLDRI